MTTEATTELALHAGFSPPAQSHAYLHTLLSEVAWSDDYYEAFGRRIAIPRRQAWYADPGIRYREPLKIQSR